MKSFVQSLYLFTTAIGSALNEALVPATGDPDIVSQLLVHHSIRYIWVSDLLFQMWMYTGIAIASCAVAAIFWFTFHHYDQQEEEMNKLDAHDSFAGKAGEESDGEKDNAHR